jgi:hypothetical protein
MTCFSGQKSEYVEVHSRQSPDEGGVWNKNRSAVAQFQLLMLLMGNVGVIMRK